MLIPYHTGDIVEMKKKHPCGTNQWAIMRTGVDFRLKCLGCGRILLLPRPKFEKSVKKILQTSQHTDKDTVSAEQ